MLQRSVVAEFYAPPPPPTPILPEFNLVFSPPPPYQEDLPLNHCYKSGTRVTPAQKLVLQLPYFVQQTPNLDSTYEHVYCDNLILPRPGDCLKKSAELEKPPATTDGGNGRGKRSSLWRNLVRKVTRRRQSAGLKQRSISAGLKSVRSRSLSSEYRHCVFQTNPATPSSPTSTAPHLLPSVKPRTPPPRGIVKPPRQFKKSSPSNLTSDDSYCKLRLSDQESSNSLNKIKKSVSFSNITTSSLIPSTDARKGMVLKSYVVNGYVFTKL